MTKVVYSKLYTKGRPETLCDINNIGHVPIVV